jgi:hypothetical protein
MMDYPVEKTPFERLISEKDFTLQPHLLNLTDIQLEINHLAIDSVIKQYYTMSLNLLRKLGCTSISEVFLKRGVYEYILAHKFSKYIIAALNNILASKDKSLRISEA